MCMVSDKLADFNPHSRVGSDQGQGLNDAVVLHFNPHSRVGSDFTSMACGKSLQHFNPHSRVGSDDAATNLLMSIVISIHTPA